MSKPKDRTPPEVKSARRAKERRRLWVGGGFFALWWVLFAISLATNSPWLMNVSFVALAGEFVVLYGLHEKALRQITGRPAADYTQIRRLERAERKTRPAAVELSDPDGGERRLS